MIYFVFINAVVFIDAVVRPLNLPVVESDKIHVNSNDLVGVGLL